MLAALSPWRLWRPSRFVAQHLPPPEGTFPSEVMARSAAARQYMQRVREDLSTLLRFNVDKVGGRP